ncbi:MAG: MMPL family transporter [Kiritimatiellae bacterium]|nr:MMPL family transporter [Kiritimatiellia bacterium]
MNRWIATRLFLPMAGALLLAGLVWMQFQPKGVELDSSARTLLASDPRNRETFDKLHELIPDTVMVLVALEIEDLFSNDGAAIIEEASNLMLTVPGAVEVKSLTHSGRPVREGFSLVIEPFIPLYASEETWAELEAFNTRFPLSRNVLVSSDSRYAVLVGVYERNLPDHAAREAFRRSFMNTIADLEGRVLAKHVLSFPFVEAEAQNILAEDLSRYAIWAGILIALVLFVTFRSVPAVLYILAMETAGMMLLAFIFVALGHAVNLHTGILFPLVGGLQLTFVAHYVAALQRAGAPTPRQSASIAFAEVFRPSVVAALTTMAGLGMLAISDLEMVSNFGRIGAFGVAGVFLLTFLLPIFHAKSCADFTEETNGPSADFPFAHLLIQHRKWVFGLFALLVSAMLPGITRIRTDVRAMEFVAPDHPVRETLDLLNDELGGINIFQLEVRTGVRYGMQTLPVLRYLEDLRAHAMSLDGVSDAYAYSQLYIALNQIWEGDRMGERGLPETPARIGFFSNLLNMSPLLFKDAFVDSQASQSLMVIRSRDMPGQEYLGLLAEFMGYAEAKKPEGVTLNPVQGLHTILEGDRQIVRNQTRTLGLSLLVITLMLCGLWRSPRIACLVILSNIPALLTLFGVMGWTGLPLNSVTVMVAAVLLGIAVDDGIHLASYVRAQRQRGVPRARAVSDALRAKIKPMACTSAILSVFLGLLVLASFPPVAHFGLLGATGMVMAFAGAVLLLPALLSTAFSK